MSKKVRVWNRSYGMHHFVFSDGRKVLPIPPGGFNMIPVEEIYYADSTSKSFKKGILEIDPSEKELLEELGYEKREPNVYTPEEIEKLLSGNFTKDVKEKISAITERHAKEKLIQVARKMDLSQSKVKFIEETTGIKVYDELAEEVNKVQVG